jgi:hypothetical protein
MTLDYPGKDGKWTAAQLLEKLYWQYQMKIMSTAVIPEASIGHHSSWDVGFKDLESLGTETSVRRIDALVLFTDKRWAVEIKVSLKDLKVELATPEKQTLWKLHTHSFYFLVAPALLEYALANVPKEFGVMSPHGSYIKVFRRAKRNAKPYDLPYSTVLRMGVAYGKSYRELKRLGEFPIGVEL